MFDRVRKRFYRAEGNDPSWEYIPMKRDSVEKHNDPKTRGFWEHDGWTYDYDPKAGKRMRGKQGGKAFEETIQLDHEIEIQDDPTKALDPDNLMWSQGGPRGTVPKGSPHDIDTHQRRQDRAERERQQEDPRATQGGRPSPEDRSTEPSDDDPPPDG